MHRRTVSSRSSAATVASTMLLMLSTLVGCGGPAGGPGGTATDEQRIPGLVSSLSGGAINPHPGAFEVFFAEGSVPEDRDPYKSRIYGVTSVSIEGEKATATVSVKDNEGKPLGEVKWTLVKEGENWKIKDAPLPKAGS